MSTSYLRRLVVLGFVVAALLALSAPLLAADGLVLATAESEEEAPADAEPAPAGEQADVPTPAVAVEPEEDGAAAPEWTFRFLLPTTLALGGLAVVGTTIAYFAKVTKARYRVVE